MEKTEWKGLDRREAPRWNLKVPLRLFDTVTDELVGNVVNVSIGGMLVVGNQLFDPHRTLHFTLELPEDNGQWSKIPVHVLGKYGTQDSANDLYRIGFQFVDITPDVLFRLQRLIDDIASFS